MAKKELFSKREQNKKIKEIALQTINFELYYLGNFKYEDVVEWQTRYFEGVVSLARVRSSRIVLTIRKHTSSQYGLKFFYV